MNLDNFIDAIATICVGLGLNQLPNAYNVESNSERFLINGFGIAIGTASYTEPNGLISREIAITLTKQNKGNHQCPNLINDNSKALTSLSSDIMTQLNSVVSTYSYVSDDGIILFGGEDDNEYASHQFTLNFRYIDRGLSANC